MTIPKSFREQINLAEGDYVQAEVENGSLVIRPVTVRRISEQDREAAVGALDSLWREMGEVDAEEIQELVNEAIRETRKRDQSRK